MPGIGHVIRFGKVHQSRNQRANLGQALGDMRDTFGGTISVPALKRAVLSTKDHTPLILAVRLIQNDINVRIANAVSVTSR
jgi:hypothetical protein